MISVAPNTHSNPKLDHNLTMTSGIEPIIVASDLSPGADTAIIEGDRRARAADAPLLVCHVMPDVVPSAPLFPQRHADADLAMPALTERAMDAVGSRVAELTGRTGGNVEIRILNGTVEDAVAELAEITKARLVILGSGTPHGLVERMLGDTTAKVLRVCPCPVLVARPHELTGETLGATDFSDPVLPVVLAASEDAHARGAHITLLHSVDITPAIQGGDMGIAPTAVVAPETIQDLQTEAHERLEETSIAYGVDADCLTPAGPAAGAILDAAESINADLIIVGTAGRTGLKRMFLGNVAEDIVKSAPCSVLVVRLHRDEAA